MQNIIYIMPFLGPLWSNIKPIVRVESVVIVLMAPFVDVVAGLLSAGCCPAEDITDRSPPQSSQPSHQVYPCNAQFSFKLVSPHSPPHHDQTYQHPTLGH